MPLPKGYRLIFLELSDQEYEKLCGQRALTGPGTDSAALRLSLGMSERPRGIYAAERREEFKERNRG